MGARQERNLGGFQQMVWQGHELAPKHIQPDKRPDKRGRESAKKREEEVRCTAIITAVKTKHPSLIIPPHRSA